MATKLAPGRFVRSVLKSFMAESGLEPSNGGKVGDTIHATATCDKIGKTLAYTTITFKNGKGELAARGSHTKYVAQAWGAHPEYTAPKDMVVEGEEN
ncbi:putative thioesterase superfamily protein [Phaeoacremonium minimum UCRPA7]|uniref:Putative thioesterase superfamily protein n=1 Tax=Phaeoacremonium minimum (strain UCR-PA7) TaxID=1286976 RepID=R8BVC4_PHAM7|nr:putative thioesterase superfamily protein [Phaeoacremonium minimum UCRPA7]EOO03331.1 putative thioesterase superfamily protein [Phaeoacremonium minimum UCRPA7]